MRKLGVKTGEGGTRTIGHANMLALSAEGKSDSLIAHVRQYIVRGRRTRVRFLFVYEKPINYRRDAEE